MCPGRFFLTDALNGYLYLWHELYSLSHTSVLGFVACHSAKWFWEDVKQIKDGKQSNLRETNLEKKAIFSLLQKKEKISSKMLPILTIQFFDNAKMQGE